MRKKLYCQNKLNLHDFSFSFSIIQNNLKKFKEEKNIQNDIYIKDVQC